MQQPATENGSKLYICFMTHKKQCQPQAENRFRRRMMGKQLIYTQGREQSVAVGLCRCRPVSLPACVGCRPVWLPACVAAGLCRCRPVSLPACRPSDRPDPYGLPSLPACVSAGLCRCRPVSLPACVAAGLYRCRPVWLPASVAAGLCGCRPVSLPARIDPTSYLRPPRRRRP